MSDIDLKAIFEEVQRRKDEAVRELTKDPKLAMEVAEGFMETTERELPNMPKIPAAAAATGGVAWIARLLNDAGLENEQMTELFGVVDTIEQTMKERLFEMGGVMTPAQGVSAGIGGGFFTGFWMGLLLKEARERELHDALDAALDAIVNRPPNSSLYTSAIRQMQRALYGEPDPGSEDE